VPDESRDQEELVLTRKRLSELIGGENALALIQRFSGHQVPDLTPRAAELMRLNRPTAAPWVVEWRNTGRVHDCAS